MELIETYIVERNDLIREGIKSFIQGAKFHVAQEFKSITCPSLDDDLPPPSLIIVGINGKLSTTSITHAEIGEFKDKLNHLRSKFPKSCMILLISVESLCQIPDLYSWDADGFICRDNTKDAFLYYLNLALIGERVIPAPAASFYSNGNHRSHNGNMPAHSNKSHHDLIFSEREHDIIRYIAKGESNKLIAYQLNITESTVKVHLKGILRKIGVHNRTQAALWAIQNGYSGLVENVALIILVCPVAALLC